MRAMLLLSREGIRSLAFTQMMAWCLVDDGSMFVILYFCKCTWLLWKYVLMLEADERWMNNDV